MAGIYYKDANGREVRLPGFVGPRGPKGDKGDGEALKGYATGAAVRMDDVSLVAHEMAVKVRSKNILPYPYASTSEKTTNGITFTPNADRSITISGVATADAYYQLWNADLGDKSVANGGTNGLYTFSQMIRYNVGNKNISVYVPSGSDFTEPITIYPQIEQGITESAYTPYIEDVSAVKVVKYGKNLLNAKAPYGETAGSTTTIEGETITLAKGATGNAPSIIWEVGDYKQFEGKEVTLSFDLEGIGGDGNTAFPLYSMCGNTRVSKDAHTVGNGYMVKPSEVGTRVKFTSIIPAADHENVPLCIRVYMNRETTEGDYIKISNVQLELDGATDFEPYIEPTEHTVNPDGTMKGVISLPPTTTLMTDTEGAVIEVEYNRDINKAFDELKQAIISLGGNV